MARASEEARTQLRWRLADESAGPQQALFDEEPPAWRAGHGEFRGLEFLEVRAQRVINPVPPQSRLSFRWTINAYRGCSHACSFCFARPTHEYLNLNTGADFDRRIVVKVNAVERVRAEVAAKRWAGDLIAMGTNMAQRPWLADTLDPLLDPSFCATGPAVAGPPDPSYIGIYRDVQRLARTYRVNRSTSPGRLPISAEMPGLHAGVEAANRPGFGDPALRCTDR